MVGRERGKERGEGEYLYLKSIMVTEGIMRNFELQPLKDHRLGKPITLREAM